MNEFSKIKIATMLADAMIKEVKGNNKLIEDIIEFENADELMETITKVFAFKLMPVLLEYTESEELQNEMSEQDKADIEVFKNIFNK